LTIGAVDFMAKPVEPSLLLSRLNQHQQLYEVEQNKFIQPSDEFVGECLSIDAIRKQIMQFADSPFPVLITGDSGTGKEIIAKLLHSSGARKPEPYMVINCAAIAPELLEAQLFGHRKGAFTGAEKEHNGFFIEVGKGTLFLDEVGELPISLQSKLLRVLESGEFYRVGETQQQLTKARIVAATNKNLVEEVAKGDFRADLYHRLSILNVQMPSLCDREEDKLLLLDHFQAIYSETVPPFALDEEARELWVAYDFPGNVRELRNIVIRLGTKYPGEKVSRQHLKAELETRLSANNLQESTQHFSDEYITGQIQSGDFKLDDIVGEVESRCIRLALELYDNNVSKAANALHINRTTLYSRVNKLGK
jgi:DNA-binding NtrC family response regulator